MILTLGANVLLMILAYWGAHVETEVDPVHVMWLISLVNIGLACLPRGQR